MLCPFIICFSAFFQVIPLHKFFLCTCRGIAVGHTPGVLTDATVSKPWYYSILKLGERTRHHTCAIMAFLSTSRHLSVKLTNTSINIYCWISQLIVWCALVTTWNFTYSCTYLEKLGVLQHAVPTFRRNAYFLPMYNWWTRHTCGDVIINPLTYIVN